MVLTAIAVVAACGSTTPTSPGQVSSSRPAHSSGSPSAIPASSANASCAGGTSGPWPGYCTIFGPLPSSGLAAQLATLDRDYQLAWNEAVYTKGSSTQWENYVTSQMAGYLQADLPSDIATGASFYHDVTVQITDVTVSSMPDFAGNEMVDFCLHRNGSLDYEEQDSLSQVNGAWKINTIDTFTSTSGHTLPFEPTECYASATPGS